VTKIIWRRPHRIRRESWDSQSNTTFLWSPRVSTPSRTSIRSDVFDTATPRDRHTDWKTPEIVDRNSPHVMHSMQPNNVHIHHVHCILQAYNTLIQPINRSKSVHLRIVLSFPGGCRGETTILIMTRVGLTTQQACLIRQSLTSNLSSQTAYRQRLIAVQV